MSLFDSTPLGDESPSVSKSRPLAERMRPERIEDYIG
jgi:replication-associated recombination protein RarA